MAVLACSAAWLGLLCCSKQPRVLDRDRRLARQADHEVEVGLGERAADGLVAPDRHHADHLLAREQRREDHRLGRVVGFGAGDVSHARVVRWVVDDLGHAALRDVAGQAIAQLHLPGFVDLGVLAQRHDRAAGGHPAPAAAARHRGRAADPWRARRSAPARSADRAWPRYRGRPRPARPSRRRGAVSLNSRAFSSDTLRLDASVLSSRTSVSPKACSRSRFSNAMTPLASSPTTNGTPR